MTDTNNGNQLSDNKESFFNADQERPRILTIDDYRKLNNQSLDEYFMRISYELPKDQVEDIVNKKISEADKGENTFESQIQNEIDNVDGKLLLDAIIEEEEDSK